MRKYKRHTIRDLKQFAKQNHKVNVYQKHTLEMIKNTSEMQR